jgi:hypothetical protein
LHQAGAEIIAGDLADGASLDAAMRDAYGSSACSPGVRAIGQPATTTTFRHRRCLSMREAP